MLYNVYFPTTIFSALHSLERRKPYKEKIEIK